MALTILDFVIIGLIALSVLMGLWRGFLRELISLLSWVAALILSLKFSAYGMQILSFVPGEKLRYGISVAAIFIIVLVIGAIINALIGKVVSTSGLGFIDRILGLLFGAARGALFVVVLLLIIGSTPYASHHWVSKSILAPHFSGLVHYFSVMAPKKMEVVLHWIKQTTSHV